MRLSGTKTNSIHQYRGLGDQLWDLGGARPSLDLQFSATKNLIDSVSGQSLVTFTRASSGTYVGSDGLIKTATTNLQTWSEDFRNTADAGATRPWTYNTSAVTADSTTAPNGTITADLVAGAAGSANKFLSNNVSTTTTGFYVFSVFLKQGTEQFVVVRLTDGAANGIRGRFDLSAGTVVVTNEGTATGQATSIAAVGNGWYRCVVSCSFSSLAFSVVQPQLWLNNFVSTSLVTNYFAWGAQLEQSSTVGEYIPTTSTINSAPRFDHNPTTGESLGLLVEEQRTNYIRNNTIVGAVAGTPGTAPTNWTASAATNLSREVIGTGVENGINYIDLRFTGTVTAARTQYIFFEPSNQIAAINGQSWAGSAWLKLAGGSLTNITSVSIQADTRDSALVYVNTPYNSAISLTSTLTRFAASGLATGASVAWVQPFVQFTTAASGSIDITLRIGLPQLEQGAFATSVIPTTTAAATRNADVASITGTAFSSWYRQDEGTFYADVFRQFAVPATDFPVVADCRTGTNINQISYLTEALAGTYAAVSGVSQSELYSGGLAGVRNRRLAHGYAANNFAATANGSIPLTDTSGSVPTVSAMSIGSVSGNAQFLNGTIRRLTYWPQRLSNSTLQSITQ